MKKECLPDVLSYELIIVFCGNAVSVQSKIENAYYAGRGNKFWQTLSDLKFTDVKLESYEFKQVKKYGIGLTDLIKNQSGSDTAVFSTEDDRRILTDKILKYKPKFLVFNGKKAAKSYFNKDNIEYGKQDSRDFDNTRIFVLPSTAGLASGYWNITYWSEMSNIFKKQKNRDTN